MIRKIKKEKAQLKKGDRDTFLQKLYAKEKIFFRLTNLLLDLLQKLSDRQELKDDFSSLMRASASDKNFVAIPRNFWIPDSDYFHRIVDQNVLDLLSNPKYQRKIGYTCQIMTGSQLVDFWDREYFSKREEDERLWEIKRMEETLQRANLLHEEIFYLIRHD